MVHQPKRIAVIGAGPIGLEAALYGVQAGYDVQVFERGCVASNVLDWGHVRLFSPFEMNASEWGRRAVDAASIISPLPKASDIVTGRELARRYLIPLSQLSELAGRIDEGVDVAAVSRSQTWKNELIGHPRRADDPFQLVLRHADNQRERTFAADYVFDCSGTYPNHNWIGAGGAPCLGEAYALADSDYHLPDVLADSNFDCGGDSDSRPDAGTGRTRSASGAEKYAGKQTLVIGSGFSAATTVVSLAKLSEQDPETEVVWLTRALAETPLTRIVNDQLPERDRLVKTANRLAAADAGPVYWMPGHLIAGIQPEDDGDGFIVVVEKTRADPKEAFAVPRFEPMQFDHVIANVGYRPDRRVFEELQIHECFATGGPIKLAAALLGESSADCLNQSGHGAETLRNPEPGFFILGSKSYGRDSRFLLQIGFQQIVDVFQLIAAERA